MIQQARQWARVVKRDVHAIYLAARDPRVPWYAKALALCVAGYALSPIDLIPDFVPVLGYLDDVIIVPLGNPSPDCLGRTGSVQHATEVLLPHWDRPHGRRHHLQGAKAKIEQR